MTIIDMTTSAPSRLRCVGLAVATFLVCAMLGNAAQAQTAARRLALKDGESIELYPVYWVISCRSALIGMPEVEILEGPPQISMSIRKEKVLPRRQGCAATVPGGTLLLSAKGVTEKVEARVTYRVKYKTRAGDRQTGGTYIVSLFPQAAQGNASPQPNE